MPGSLLTGLSALIKKIWLGMIGAEIKSFSCGFMALIKRGCNMNFKRSLITLTLLCLMAAQSAMAEKPGLDHFFGYLRKLIYSG